METVLLSSHIWHTVYQEAQCTWNSAAPAASSARLLASGCPLAAPCALQLPLAWSGFRAWPDTHLLAGFLYTTSCSINFLQKWYPTTLCPSPSTAPAHLVQKSVKHLRDQQDKAGRALPYREVQVRSARSGVGFTLTGLSQAYTNCTAKIFIGLHLCYIKRIRNCTLRNWCCIASHPCHPHPSLGLFTAWYRCSHLLQVTNKDI